MKKAITVEAMNRAQDGEGIVITHFSRVYEPKTIHKVLAEVRDDDGTLIAVSLKEVRNPKWRPARL